MKDKINDLAKGIFEYEKPALEFSEEQIRISVAAGEQYQGSFTISDGNKRKIKGFLVTDCGFLNFSEDTFYADSVNIAYSFDASSMSAGEAVKTVVEVITDCGEYSIPFIANIEVPSCQTALGTIKDLFHFANFAREEPEEAVKLFQSDFFENTFLYRDSKNISIYRGLHKSKSKRLAMEEFLVAVHKKLPVHIRADKTSYSYLDCSESFMEEIILTKDNWGYMEFDVHSDADFLCPDYAHIHTDQFNGNNFRLRFVVRPEYMLPGKNYGRICISSPIQTMEIEVVAEHLEHNTKEVSEKLQVQECIANLVQYYLDFRMEHLALDSYQDKIETLLYHLDGVISHNTVLLYRFHLAIMDNRESTVKEYLDIFERKGDELRRKSPVEYCASLYLRALYTKDSGDIHNAVKEIRYHFEHGSYSWQVFWFLLYLDEVYENPHRRLKDIYKIIADGCHSPVIYFEAYQIYKQDVLMLQELNEQSIAVMNFVIRRDLADKELALQYAYLATRLRGFHPLVYYGMTTLYEQYPDEQILSAICSMLIRGHKNQPGYHKWYVLGVEHNLRIVDLYEYYMYTFPEDSDEKIARKVLLYFVHDNHLPVEKKAFLFAYLIRHKEEYPQEFAEYYKSMRQFMEEQLEAGNVSRNMAYIYEECITSEDIDKKMASLLPQVMFRYEIVCDNPEITGVYVVQREKEGEIYTPITEHKAIVEIITDNAEVFLSDKKGNRYCETIPYTLSRLAHMDKFANDCYEQNKDDERLLLFLYHRIEQLHKSGNETLMIRKRILELPGLSRHERRKCFSTMVQYYFDNFEGERLEELLKRMDWNLVMPNERGKIIEYCIIRNLYYRAFEGINLFGYEGVPRKRLLQLASFLIQDMGEDVYDIRLVRLCDYIFKAGKFDENILNYLIRHYQGTARELFALWRVAEGFELDKKELEERLIAQMLFADSYIAGSHKVFVSFYQGGSNKKIVRAYLAYSAYRYLIRDIQLHQDVFEIMRLESLRENNRVCILALLKYYSEKRTLKEEEESFCDYYLQKMTDEKSVFGFFKKFGGKVTLPYSLRDKYLIEYTCNPAHVVTIHYRIEKPGGSEEFISETMENRFEGIHVKEFLLFHGETLQYYITEQTEKGQEITESISVTVQGEIAEDVKEESRYHILNAMIISRQMRDEKTLIDTMEEYAKDEGVRRGAFKPLSANGQG